MVQRNKGLLSLLSFVELYELFPTQSLDRGAMANKMAMVSQQGSPRMAVEGDLQPEIKNNLQIER